MDNTTNDHQNVRNTITNKLKFFDTLDDQS